MRIDNIPASTSFRPSATPAARQPMLFGQIHPLGSVLPADEIRFSGQGKKADRLTAEEAEKIAKIIEKSEGKIQPSIQHQEAVKAIMAGEPVPTQDNGKYVFGMLTKDRKVISSDPLFRGVMEALLNMDETKSLDFPADAGELPIAIKLYDDKSKHAVDDFIQRKLIPTFKVEGEIELGKQARRPLKNQLPGLRKNWQPEPKTLQVMEAPVWPFFEALLSTDREVSAHEEVKALEKELLGFPIFQLVCPDSPALEKQLHDAFEPMRKNLAGLMTMQEHYVNSVDRGLVAAVLSGACALGLAGEIGIEQMPHGVIVDGVRSLLVGAVDAFDNFTGSVAIMLRNIKGSGKKVNTESIFGKKSMKDAAKSGFKLEGEASEPLKEGIASAVHAAGLGTAISVLPNKFVLGPSDGHGIEPLYDGMAGALISTGTALAIPINVRKKLVGTYVAIQRLIDEGKIEVPDGIDRDKYARLTAEQDMLSSIEFSSQMKAMTMVAPTSGMILGSEGLAHMAGLHVPHEWFMRAFMAGAASMENILTLGHINRRLHKFPGMVRRVQDMILQAPADGFSRKELRQIFADGYTRKTASVLTKGVKLPGTDKIKQFKEVSIEAETPAAGESSVADQK